MAWISVITLEALPVGGSAHLTHQDKSVAVFRQADGFSAVSNFCPHRGAQMHEGGIFEGTLICPWHQWQFDLKTGRGLTVPGSCLEVYPVKCEDGTVWVELND
jgi:nitrite reductase/ring-hydroxylating ferredoxin subunit